MAPGVLSAAEFQARYGSGAQSSGSTDLGSISPSRAPEVLSAADFQARYKGESNLGAIASYLGDSAKQFGAGAVEGTGGFLGMLADLSPVSMAEKIGNFVSDKVFSENQDRGLSERLLSNTSRVNELTTAFLPERDSEHRYARTLGQFVGPQAVLNAPGMAAATGLRAVLGAGSAGMASSGAAALGAQAGEDVFPGNPVVPLVASIFSGAAPSIFSNAAKGIYSALRPATADQLRGSAALALKEQTGLTPKAISAAIKATPDDALGKLMTTAELTDNAGMAQIEKTLSASGPEAVTYAGRNGLRQGAREEMIGAMSSSTGVNKEGLGTALMNKANETQQAMNKVEGAVWQAFPRNATVDISKQQKPLAAIVNAKRAGLPLDRRVETLVGQFMDEPYISSGALQDIRSDALALSRDANLTPTEGRILTALTGQIESAAKTGLPEGAYDIWKTARGITATEKATFSRGTSGGSLTADTARPSNVLANAFKGDTQSVKEIRAAVANDPAIMEDVKRGILDMIPRTAAGEVTTNGMKKFLAANEGGLKEILGDDHYGQLNRILSDLRSQDKVLANATLASKGNSATAQRTTVAGKLNDIMIGSLIPGTGPLASIAESLRASVGQKNEAAIREMLFKAAMEPEYAYVLSQAPTTTRIFKAGEWIKKLAGDSVYAGTKAGTIAVGRPDASAVNQSSFSGLSEPATEGRSAPKDNLLPSQSSPASAAGRPTSADTIRSSQTDSSLNYRTNPDPNQAKFNPASYDMPIPKNINPQALETLMDAIKHVESRGNTKALSKVGAKGQYQLMDATGREYHAKLGIEDKYDPSDPTQSRAIAKAYILDLLQMFDGDVQKAVTAYHSGQGNVKKGKIGPEGRKYFPLVQTAFDRLYKA